jgi:hypothetical protein
VMHANQEELLRLWSSGLWITGVIQQRS